MFPHMYFCTAQELQAWVSLLLRPTVCPEVPGVTGVKSMEVRFFAPASLVANLDFVESIFGNAGDPYLPRNDAALDVLHWLMSSSTCTQERPVNRCVCLCLCVRA
jgi:hypothetical protein